MSKMMIIAEGLGKPFECVTKEELVHYLSCINKKYSDATMEQMKCLIKKFYYWMGKEDLTSWIKLQLAPYKKDIGPEELWTFSEIKQLIKAFPRIQHQALVAVLYESEARISEIISMNISDIKEQGDILEIWLRESKTKKRSVKLCHSVIYLKKWLEENPYKNLPDHPLWISNSDRSKGKKLKPSSINEMFHNAQKRSGINKRITPHLMRHSYCSYLRQIGYGDGPHRIRMGLSPGSKVIERYTHISQSKANDEYLKTQGVKVPEDEEEEKLFTPIKCWKCGTVNTPTTRYCTMCSSNITVESAERDFTILEIFKTNFAKEVKIDIETLISEYKHVKIQSTLLEQFYGCFNGQEVLETERMRQHFKNLTENQLLELLGILRGYQLIDIVGNKIFLLDREKFEQEIEEHKTLIKVT